MYTLSSTYILLILSGHQGEMDGADESFKEKAPDEQSILRYEEHITELLVTVAQLHSKIEDLQQQKAR